MHLQLAFEEISVGVSVSYFRMIIMLSAPSLLIGVSLSEPHTSETALQDVCTCMSGTTDHIPNT